MNKPPRGWPQISSALYYKDARQAIDWLCQAFGFEVKLLVEGEGGVIEHSELTLGEGLIMVSDEARMAARSPWAKAPQSLGGANTQNMMAYVDDVDAHCARARAAGAKIVSELKTTDHGKEYWEDRGYEAEDLGGHHWWFTQRLRSAS